jgi:hypothetical protein
VRRLALVLGVAAACLAPAGALRADDDGPADESPWEDVVFLPDSGLAILLERDPKGVLLDRKAYLDLHRRARAAKGDLSGAAGDWKAHVVRCEADGVVDGERARLRVRLAVAVRGGGTESVALPAGAAVLSATLDGAPAALGADGEGKSLALRVRGDGIHEALLEIAVPVTRKGGSRSVVAPLPPALVSRWSLEVPGRVTAAPGAGARRVERLSKPDRTRIVSYPTPAAPGVAASWREGDEGTDLPPLVGAMSRTLVEVGERSLAVSTVLFLQVHRRPESKFKVHFPSGLQLLGVDSESPVVLGDSIDDMGARTLSFPEPFTGSRTVVIRATRALGGPGAAEFVAPTVFASLPVTRVVAVRFADGLRGFVEPGSGAERVDGFADPKEGAVDAVLRLTEATPLLRVRTERPRAKVAADVRAVVDLAEDGPWLAASFLYRPRGDRLYGVRPLLPAGFAPDSVVVSGDLPHVRSLGPDGRLDVVFPGGVDAGGAVAVVVRGRLPVEGWTSEEWSAKTVPFPRLDAGEVESTDGFLGIAAPPGLEAREEDAGGLEPAAVTELRERAGFTSQGLTLGYRFRSRVEGGSVRATRPAAAVTAAVGVLAGPEEDHVRWESTVRLSVQRGGVREARLVVKPPVGERVRVEGPDVAERRLVPGKDADVWVVRFARRVRDGSTLVLRADLPLAGGGAAIPVVSVEGAARSDLHVGVEGGGELEVEATAQGLRDADPADLAPVLGPRSAGLLLAWKGERGVAPSISLHVARLPAAALPPAYADSVVLRTVLGADGIARTRLTAQVRNADRQSLEVSLPPGAALVTARVRGEAVRPLLTAEKRLTIPLVRSAEPFEVVLVYEESLDADSGSAALLSPDLGLKGGVSEWTVRLPDGSVVVEASGDFATPPAIPGVPILVRFLRALFENELGGSVAGRWKAAPRGAAGPPPPASVVAQSDAEVEMEPAAEGAGENAPIFGKTEEGSGPPPAATPAPAKPAGERIAGRAAREGIFGMDVRLLESGPAVTASRLTPGGALDLRWRTREGRSVGAALAGILAFLAGLLGRRRRIPAPAWIVLAFGLLTAAPAVLASQDTAAFDGAVLGTVAFAVVALGHRIARSAADGRLAKRGRRVPAAAALLVLALLAPAARADDKKPAPPKPAPAVPPERVYVPYDPEKPESLRTPQRVFLSYARYVELWNAAHPEDRIESARPPILASAQYDARVEERVLVVEARFEIDPADGGLVPLPPGGAPAEVRLDGKPVAATTLAPGGATVVPVPRAAKPGARARLEGTFRFPIVGRAPGGVVRAALVPAPRSRLRALLPLADAVVSLGAFGGWSATASGAGATLVEAELGPVAALEFGWSPRAADAAGGRVRWEARTEEVITLEADRVGLFAAVRLDVSGGALESVDLALPEGFEPSGVEGPEVASWSVAGSGAERRLRVRLSGAGPGHAELFVAAVRSGAAPAAGMELPDLAVTGAASETVTLHVGAEDARLVATESRGFERVEAKPDFGEHHSVYTGNLKASWRRTRLPARLAVRADRLPATLEVRSRHHLHLGADASLLRVALEIVPGPQGIHEVLVPLPEGWTLEEAGGGEAFPAEGRVRLVLPGAGPTARAVDLRLRGPAAGDGPYAFPRLKVDGATRESDELLVSTAPGTAATAASVEGLVPVPVDRFASWPALDPAETRSLAYRADRGGGALSVRREALRPTVRPTVVADVTVLDDRAIVDALLVFDVRGGPARSFRFRAPPGVKDVWVLGEGLRDWRTALVDGREVTTVTLQAPATGEVLFRALYDVPVPAGAEAQVTGPEPLDGDGPRAFVFVRALGDAEARLGESRDLEPCDVSDLPRIPDGLDARRVLRFFRARDAAWRLPLRIVTHEAGAIPDARVHLLEALTVADRDGSSRTRVDARLFNRKLAFLPVTLPEGATLESVTAGGAPVRPVTRAARPGVVFVPVRRQSLGEESQVVSVTFSTPASTKAGRFGSFEPRLPEFPGVSVDATTWRVLLPEDRDYSFSGNLDPVEAVEIAIARAEAYASDVQRLRQVAAEGSESQQELAVSNIVSNTAALRQTLEEAKSRMDDLEQAASEGRVDKERVAQSRRKAEELSREIEGALRDVQERAPRVADRLETAPIDEAESVQVEDTGKLGTKEGQAAKQWSRNEGLKKDGKGKDAEGASRAQVAARRQAEAGAAPRDVEKNVAAYLVHQRFDAGADAPFEGPGVNGPLTADSRQPQEPAAPDDSTIGVGSGGGAGGFAAGRVGGKKRPALLPIGGAGFQMPAGGDGGGGTLGDFAAGYRMPAPPVAGLVSLTPPLEERGRAYAFRKLDSGAVLTVRARPRDLGSRLLAAAAFALLCGLVWIVDRRRSRA